MQETNLSDSIETNHYLLLLPLRSLLWPLQQLPPLGTSIS